MSSLTTSLTRENCFCQPDERSMHKFRLNVILGIVHFYFKYISCGNWTRPQRETANLLQQFSLSPWRRLRHHRHRRQEKKQQKREKLGRPLLPSRSERERGDLEIMKMVRRHSFLRPLRYLNNLRPQPSLAARILIYD